MKDLLNITKKDLHDLVNILIYGDQERITFEANHKNKIITINIGNELFINIFTETFYFTVDLEVDQYYSSYEFESEVRYYTTTILNNKIKAMLFLIANNYEVKIC